LTYVESIEKLPIRVGISIQIGLCIALQHMSLIVLCATSGVARETFRKTFKEENPDVKGVTAVS
jgi:hypothetical protein